MNMGSYTGDQIATQFIYKVYSWMALGLGITAATAYTISHSSLITVLAGHSWLFITLLLLQLGLVIGLSFFINKLSYSTASILFVIYSFITGITLSTIFLAYPQQAIIVSFIVAAAMFAALALYGYLTKKDLTALGSIAMMALFGLLVSLVVNLFLKSSQLDYILSILGVIIFAALTAFDVQNIKRISQQLLNSGQTGSRVSIIGALTLYLDFINIFLMLLNLRSKRN